MASKDTLGFENLAKDILGYLLPNYYNKIRNELESNTNLLKTFPSFILNPNKIIFYVGKNHIAMEYVGPDCCELVETTKVQIQIFDYSKSENLLEEIIGFSIGGTSNLIMPIGGVIEDLFIPSLEAATILNDNGWNYNAQSMIWGVNMPRFDLERDIYSRLINCFFYGTDSNGLLVRNIKWLEIFPAQFKDIDEESEDISLRLWPNIDELALDDAYYNFNKPRDFQFDKLEILNRFVELYSSSNVRETDITRFLANLENQFILKMMFFGTNIHPEIECEWQNEHKTPIRPDFFIVQPNGFADIVEFKLPYLKTNPITSKDNRESFSAEINSYIAQTRIYRKFFEDTQNRNYIEKKYSIKVLYPKRWLIIGRRWMFSTEEWREIEDEYKDFAIRTYDDIIDGILSQLYS